MISTDLILGALEATVAAARVIPRDIEPDKRSKFILGTFLEELEVRLISDARLCAESPVAPVAKTDALLRSANSCKAVIKQMKIEIGD